MMDLFSQDMRRNPYPAYEKLRKLSPVLRVPPPFDGWMVLDCEGAKWVLTDDEVFQLTRAPPRNGFIFFDPPAHTR